MRLDTDGPECPHGFPAWRQTRAGEPMCPHCRATARAAGLKPKTKTPRRPTQPRLQLDVAALAANDRDDEDDTPVASVIPMTRRRRRWEP